MKSDESPLVRAEVEEGCEGHATTRIERFVRLFGYLQATALVRHVRQKSRCSFARFTALLAKNFGRIAIDVFRRPRRRIGRRSAGLEWRWTAQTTQFYRIS